MPGFQVADAEDGADDAGNEQEIDAAADAEVGWRLDLADRGDEAILPVVPDIEHDEDREHETGNECRFEPEMPGRPEEVDAVQETDEQRRIAERRECAADIGDEEDEEHDDVDVVKARGIGARERADQDHGRAGSTDHAGDQGAEGEDRAVDEWRAAQVSRHQDAAGHHVEREQHHDEAQIFRRASHARRPRWRRARRAARRAAPR